MNKIISHAFCLCTLFVPVVIGAIIEKPLNMATKIGGETFFNCSNNNTEAITWLYATDFNAATSISLTESNCQIGSNYASHYRTEKAGFTCNLIVFNTLLSHGGIYTCADGLGVGRTFQAILIIVDPNATITTNTSDFFHGEDVMISNNVSYRGPSILPPMLPPFFYWTLQSDTNQNIASYAGSTTETTASSYIVVTAEPPNVSPYLCNLFFNSSNNIPAGCATNAPTYRTSWETPNYNVLYPPTNLNTSGNYSSCLSDPVVLTCSASGYPIPGYKWFNLTSGDVMSESNTVIIQSSGSYQCIASNTIRNVNYNASEVVDVDDCNPPRNVTITASYGPCSSNADSCQKLSSDSLTCNASAFPEPDYEWSYSGGRQVGPILVAKKNIEYICTATNYFGGRSHSASSTLTVYWLTPLICVNLGISDPVCIGALVIAIYFGLDLLFFAGFIIYYSVSESGRNQLNDRFQWLKKMLPCINGDGCKCSVWIFYFVLLSIFAAIVFFPTIIIMANCCEKSKKTSQGNMQLNERNGSGGGSRQTNTPGTKPSQNPSRTPASTSPPPTPPPPFNTSVHSHQDPRSRAYPQSNTHQPPVTQLWIGDPSHQNPHAPPPQRSPSPELSTNGIVYAELRIDNNPKSRQPVQLMQTEQTNYASIGIA